MAEQKHISTRIINKHATAAVWNTKTNFTPLQAETIVYDPGYDSSDGVTYEYPRYKIGDGTHNVTELPFVNKDVSTGTGLKLTDTPSNRHIEIDNDVTFILVCGTAADDIELITYETNEGGGNTAVIG